ncbi:hypothetical protein [Kocuria sp. SM24M-10]|uniref:hypothetical protein n=1 Tax=Kocuria sp. SM24M-10 TaxID=1660349 RepID=UPI00064AA3FB|nr:hypothetical protein [Kocuria sp. SM24M-10]
MTAFIIAALYALGAVLQIAGLVTAWFRLRNEMRRIQRREEMRRTLTERHAAQEAEAERTFLREYGPTEYPSDASVAWGRSHERQELDRQHRREFEDAGLPVVTLASWEESVSRGDDTTLELIVVQQLSGYWRQGLAVALGTAVGLLASVLSVYLLPVE